MAVAGYGIVAVTNIVDWIWVGRTAHAFVGLDPQSQAALENAGPATLDPTLAMRFLTLGSWMFIVSSVAGTRGLRLPRSAGLGKIAGALSVVFGLASVTRVWTAPLPGAVVAVVVHPIWLIATGLELQRRVRFP